jgi:hypothetical protein
MIAVNTSMNAQRIALTSNLLEDILVTPNVGVDVVVSDKQSISFDLSTSPYKLSETVHNKCMTFRTSYKFWFNQAFYAHYIGIDAVANSSDIQIGKNNFKDEYVGAGLSYGYSFIIGKRLNLVPSLGLGVAYGKSHEGNDHVDENGIGEMAVTTYGVKPIFTRLAVTIDYILK